MTISPMNCSQDHTEETLEKLSNQLMESMTSTDVCNYLLDAVPYMKTGDLIGWKRKFLPEEIPEPVSKPTKRLRQSPLTAPVMPMEKCKSCKSEDVIDDVRQGQIVCLSCGLIQLQGVFTADTAHCSYDRMQSMSIAYIHRYSRVLNFVNVIRMGEGDSRPEITQDTLSLLQAELGGQNVNDAAVRKALRSLGLSRRYRRHSMYFVWKFGGDTPKKIPGLLVKELAKLFLRIEFFFDKRRHLIWPKRKTFFSYKFILYQLLHQVGRPDLTGPQHLLKSTKLLNVQRDAYEVICKYTGLTFFE